MFLCILNSIELLSSSGALELDVRLIPTLLVVAHDSNVAVYAHGMLTVLRVNFVYAIVRLSSGKTMVSILHQTHRGVCPCHGTKMKNQYLFQ